MTDETESKPVTESKEVEVIETISVAEHNALKLEVIAMRKHQTELLSETKKAKSEKTTAEYERLSKKEDWKALLESSNKERDVLKKDIETMKVDRITAKKHKISIEMAASLADGRNVELLSRFIYDRLKYDEEYDKFRVLDEEGKLTVSELSGLKIDIQSSDLYKSLLKGTKASGGGASGGGSGVGTTKEITRADFDRKNPQEKMDFYTETKGLIKD